MRHTVIKRADGERLRSFSDSVTSNYPKTDLICQAPKLVFSSVIKIVLKAYIVNFAFYSIINYHEFYLKLVYNFNYLYGNARILKLH